MDNRVRSFTTREGYAPLVRDIEDAPQPMRQEFVDVLYSVCALNGGRLDADRDLYFIIEQSLGQQAAGNPTSGRRQRIGRDIADANWQRVYDIIERLFTEFDRCEIGGEYRVAVNRILAGGGVVWDLGEDGRLYRILPREAQIQVDAAFAELNYAIFYPARQLLVAAREAFDARPRRDRDACSNAFDALESVAKAKLQMPTSTFGQVLSQIGATNPEIRGILSAVNTLRNKNFGHGMTENFALAGGEVDFAYLICIAGIMLIARLR